MDAVIFIELGAAFIGAILSGYLGLVFYSTICWFATYRLFPRYISGDSIGRIELVAGITILGLLIFGSVKVATMIVEDGFGFLFLASFLLVLSVLSTCRV